MERIVDKILRFPWIFLQFAKNPRRWRNFIWLLIEYGILVAVWHFLPLRWYGAFPIAVLTAFLAFEFIAEPLGLTGYYFERGPREGEGEINPCGWTGWWEE